MKKLVGDLLIDGNIFIAGNITLSGETVVDNSSIANMITKAGGGKAFLSVDIEGMSYEQQSDFLAEIKKRVRVEV